MLSPISLCKFFVALFGFGCFFSIVFASIAWIGLTVSIALLYCLDKNFVLTFYQFHKNIGFWKPACCIVILASFGIFNSSTTISIGFYGLSKYTYFLLFIPFLPYFYYDKKAIHILFCSLLIGSGMYIIWQSWIPLRLHTNPIATSLFIALLALFSQLSIFKAKNAYQFITFYILIGIYVYYLFFINVEKTGVFVFSIIYILIVITNFKHWHVWLLTTLAVGLIIFSAYKQSTILLNRASSAYYNTDNASISERIGLIKQSLQLFHEKPVFGHGTGSFGKAVIKKKWPYLVGNAERKRSQPHNEWLHICVQWGTLGFIVFAYWVGYNFYHAWAQKQTFYGASLMVLNIAYLLGGCCDSVFYSASYRFMYIFMSCALITKLPFKKLTV